MSRAGSPDAVVIRADARKIPLPDASVDLVVTSPPYFGLRSYTDAGGHYGGQIGSEATPREYLVNLLECTREWMRVLKPSGSLFVNLGDKYSGYTNGQGKGRNLGGGERGNAHVPDGPVSAPTVYGIPNKSLMGLPWRYALACMDDLGLILRRDIIWSKPNGLPESVTDRCRSSHEYVLHLVKQPRYYAAVDAIRTLHQGKPQRQPTPHAAGALGNNARDGGWTGLERGTIEYDGHILGALPGSVWEIPSQPLIVPASLGIDHFAAFPMELPRRIILGWSPPGTCVACGEGRRPVSVAEFDRQGRTTNGPQSVARRFESPGRDVRAIRSTTITGYACGCPAPDAPTRPSVILDPFGGTGTTAMVAGALGRTGISVDKSADYCRLARWRTSDPGERAKAMQVPKPPPIPAGMNTLFGLDGAAS